MSGQDKDSDNKTNEGKGIDPTVLVAIITGLVTIIVALLGFPPLIAWIQATPTPTATQVATLHSTIAPVTVVTQSSSNTPELTSTPIMVSATYTLSPLTETPSLPIGMHPRLYADKTSGKTPLTVKLDARDSFLRAPGGEIYGCRGGACVYTWEVYSGGQRIGKPVNSSTGTFQYTFGNKGLYFITVVVCRGGGSSDCNGSGAQIEVK